MLREAAHQNSGVAQMIEKTRGGGRAHQPKQRCPSDDLDPGRCQRSVQAARFSFKAFTHRLGPLVVRQRRFADRDGGTRHRPWPQRDRQNRSEEHTSELQSHLNLVCRLLLEKKKKKKEIVTDRKLMM